MSNFLISVNAIFPFLFYLCFGYFSIKWNVTDEKFMTKLNQMIFKLFFPQMMFYNIYSQREHLHLSGKIIYICVISMLLLIAAVWLIVPMVIKNNPQRGVIIQGLYRSNTVLFAIPLTENLFGNEGVALAATVVAILVPIYNVVAIIILEYYRGKKTKPMELLVKMLTNPLLMGALVGLLFVRLHITVPELLVKPVSQFSAMASPLALFVLGGTLKPASIKGNIKLITGTLITKMIIFPAIAIGISFLLNMNALERFEYFILFAAPIAVSSYTMAENMGGDGNLAGELVIFSTVGSIVTLFLWILFMKSTCMI